MLSPAIALSNALRFNAKFLLLALIFYIPLLACFLWIVNDQRLLISQYDNEIDGFEKIERIVLLEADIASTRQGHSRNDVLSTIKQLHQVIINSNKFNTLSQQVNELSKHWQQSRNSLTKGNFTQYHNFYSQTLSLRENVAALSGLTRESDAVAFYLMEAGEQHLPALMEYLVRYKDLSEQIIEQGFDAQTYTLIVELNNRLTELTLYFTKTNNQLARVANEAHDDHVEAAKELVTDIGRFQQLVNDKLIQPDEIELSLSEARQSANVLFVKLKQYKTLNNKWLVARIHEMKANSVASLWFLSAILVSVAILSVYLLLAIYQSLTANVREINAAAERLGAGDFSTQLSVISKDELGDISRSFILMQQKIQALLIAFENDVIELRRAANHIHQVTDDMKRNIASQQKETHHVAGAIRQVSDSVNTIAENTIGAQQLTQQASENVVQGQTVVRDTEQSISDIAQEVNTSAKVINQLAKNSSEITGFVAVIREIAEQTNLLALNAAIEAARAGEQGRGFAVVADEVRTLASRTQESTAEIQRIIETLQQGANDSVTAMNQGVEKAKLGVEKTEEVQSAFTDVTTNVENIVDATMEISAAVSQQKEMVTTIDQNTANIASGADEVMQASNLAAEAGENLLTLADHLSQQLEQFTLEK